MQFLNGQGVAASHYRRGRQFDKKLLQVQQVIQKKTTEQQYSNRPSNRRVHRRSGFVK